MKYELKTEKQQGQTVTIKTNIGTLKEVWNILKEVNLDGLLTGGSLEISFNQIVDNLLLKGTLDNFCQAITEDLKEPIENLDLTDVVGIVTLFFTSIAQPFQGLNIALAQQKK
jgi:hypothetical protein